MMKTVATKLVFAALVLALAAGFTPGFAAAQEGSEGAMSADVQSDSILLRKMEWVLNDMVRCIEEMRRTDNPFSKRYLMEEIEEILFREVEFPLLYQQSDNATALDVDPIGTVSDVADAGEVSPLATLYAEAFALAGIAKGYEGFAAAAADYIARAQDIYSDVLNLQVKIDSFQDSKALSKWIADARGRWGATTPLRVTFYGKSVSQEVVDGLGLENVIFQGDQQNIDYYLYAAQRDFLRGMRRKIATDDVLKRKRINRFSLYLPPGHYRIATGVSGDYGTEIDVLTNPSKNHYMIETIEDGIAVFAVTDVAALLSDIEKVTTGRGESALGSGLEDEEQVLPEDEVLGEGFPDFGATEEDWLGGSGTDSGDDTTGNDD